VAPMVHAALDKGGGAASTFSLSHTFWAETVGCRVARAGKGRVEAVFDNACNVTLDTGGLIAVLAPRAGNVPHGIRLTTHPPFPRLLALRTKVCLTNDRIVFGAGAPEVLLSEAKLWVPELHLGMAERNGPSRIAAAQVRDLLRDPALGGRSDFLAAALKLECPATPMALRVAAVLPQLAIASRSRNSRAALAALADLVGLGPGLTPAGDDFIIGFLAGLTLASTTPEQTSLLRAICSGLETLAPATTMISRRHLDDACVLLFSERLSDLSVAIARGAPIARLARLVTGQVAVGASSGADAAAGLVFALFDCGALDCDDSSDRALH
jgi:Protein of unknown function (DUF2877)